MTVGRGAVMKHIRLLKQLESGGNDMFLVLKRTHTERVII